MNKKGKIQPPSDFAQAFSHPVKYNKAFSKTTADHEEDHSESDAMMHHYLDEEDEK
ncbi:hypothetical protein LCM20_18285 [Halobacillus litoralis]|uniref:hypothetical protein n=1 Tax=Halobacillus litoralis TaxID=45668 RepID=UPI001CD61B86|nr:hypothetical protein [Halobacillus litoralis]MCA0972550.1 hypothetical protein [Halobacillus litoralis]